MWYVDTELSCTYTCLIRSRNCLPSRVRGFTSGSLLIIFVVFCVVLWCFSSSFCVFSVLLLPVSIDCLFVIPFRCSLIFIFLVVLFSSFLYSRDKCKRCHIWVNYFKDTTFFSTTHC